MALGYQHAGASSTQEWVDFVLDSSNRPRIVAYDNLNAYARLAALSASATWNCWQLSDAPLMGGDLSYVGLDGVAVVDAGGTPYTALVVQKRLTLNACGVSFVDRLQLWLQKGTAVTASSQVCIDSTGDLFGCVQASQQGRHVAMTRASDGRVHVAYLDGSAALRYAVSNTTVTSFASETVAAGQATLGGGDISIAVDGQGAPHIAFVQSSQHAYARRIGNTWQVVVLSVPAYPSGYSGRRLTNISLKLDASGLGTMAFTVGDTLWSIRETSAMVFATAEVADGGIGMEGYPSLARATNGALHLSYFRTAPGVENLCYVQRGSGAWGTPAIVSSHTGGAGGFVHKRHVIALTSGPTPLPRIAYPTTGSGGGTSIWLA
ncbi:MAG: hypothetical protein ABL977_03345 [Candidatus Eisenbacteria bacterium]